MYLHRLPGSWLSHPFWRNRFLIDDPNDVATLRGSGLDWIEIDEGLGVPLERRSTASRVAAADMADERPLWDPEAEVDRERALVGRSKRIVKGLFDGARLGQAVRCEAVIDLVDEISQAVSRSPTTLLGVARLKTKDEYTYLHSVAVCALMVNLARHIGCEAQETRDLGVAGLLHDIGKMAVPDEILNKPGRLDEAEFRIVRSHPEAGAAMLLADPEMPAQAIEVCRHHHERVDGRGYPARLSGELLSRTARIGAICDVYDALTSDRSYKRGWVPAKAIATMWRSDGQFDRELLFRFMQSIGVFPPGALVRLRSNRLGLVLDNGRRTALPRVRAFFSIAAGEMLPPSDTAISDSLADDQILSIEDPRLWALPAWPRLRDRLLDDRAAA